MFSLFYYYAIYIINSYTILLQKSLCEARLVDFDNVKYGSIDNHNISSFNSSEFEYVILQEKLDGCNFRLIFNHETGEVSYGSGSNILVEDFNGFYRIKNSLVESVKKISQKKALEGKNFTIFGELIGYTDTGKPISSRYSYDFDDKTIKFFAMGILILDENQVSIDEDVRKYVNFLEAQDWLKESNFNVIPYEILKGEDISYDRLSEFRSLLFNHSDCSKKEGYILRVKLKHKDSYAIFKFKPKKKGKSKNPRTKYAVDDKFLDYISKVPYLDDNRKLKPECIELCLKGYTKETNARSKKDFKRFYKSLLAYCDEKPNFNDLYKEFQKIVSPEQSTKNETSEVLDP